MHMQSSVSEWLKELQMDTEEEGYIQKFEAAGYCMPNDVKNLREITEEELKRDIGVTKRGDLTIPTPS